MDARMSFARVDLGAITANARQFRQFLPATTLFGAVVKANGYGHGAVAVAQTALAAGADWLMVATVREGASLRAAGLTRTHSRAFADSPVEAPALIHYDLTPMVAQLRANGRPRGSGARSGCCLLPVCT